MAIERDGVFREDLGDPPTNEDIETWKNLKYPESINIDITDNCNLRCPHCPLPGQLIRRQELMAKNVSVTPFNIDADIVLAAYREIFSWGSRPVIQVTANGEPTLHPRLKEILCTPAEKGLDVVLTTNGTLLKPDLVNSLCLANVKTINISLDAPTQETYSKVRPSASGKNLFQTVISNIEKAVAIRNSLREKSGTKTEIMLNMIRRTEVEDEIDEFASLKEKLKVDKVVYRPLNSNAGLTSEPEAVLRINQKDGVITQINEIDRWPCQFPFKKLNIGVSWPGQLRVTWCPHGWDRQEFDLGIFPKDGTLSSLWNSQLMRQIREAHLSQTILSSSPCAMCPDWFVVSRTQPSLAKIIKSQS